PVPANALVSTRSFLHLLNVADFRGENLEQRLPPRAGESALLEPGFLVVAGHGFRRLRRRRSGADRRTQHGNPATRELLCQRFEPHPVLLEHIAQRTLSLRKTERNTTGSRVDLLR